MQIDFSSLKCFSSMCSSHQHCVLRAYYMHTKVHYYIIWCNRICCHALMFKKHIIFQILGSVAAKRLGHLNGLNGQTLFSASSWHLNSSSFVLSAHVNSVIVIISDMTWIRAAGVGVGVVLSCAGGRVGFSGSLWDLWRRVWLIIPSERCFTEGLRNGRSGDAPPAVEIREHAADKLIMKSFHLQRRATHTHTHTHTHHTHTTHTPHTHTTHTHTHTQHTTHTHTQQKPLTAVAAFSPDPVELSGMIRFICVLSQYLSWSKKAVKVLWIGWDVLIGALENISVCSRLNLNIF